MSQSEEIIGLQHQLKNEEKRKEFIEAARRLCSNRDFKKVILDFYFESEAARNVHLLAVGDKEQKEAIYNSLEGLSQFRQWFQTQCTGLDTVNDTINELKERLAYYAQTEDEDI